MIELGGYGRDRQLLRHVPWHLFAVAGIICVVSLVNLYSASRTAHAPVWIPQAVWMAAGFLGAISLLSVDYRVLHRIAWPIYVITVLMLVAVEFHGVTVMGAQRWLVIGPARLQPSEVAKLATILVLARYFHEEGELPRGHGFARVIPPAAIIAAPYLLTVIQPDLGTATMILAIAGTIVLASKVRWQVLATAGLGGVGAAVIGWLFLLHDYQRKRVLTFLDPEADALGAGYHANQSMIAVGSGQWGGKGWGMGSQTQLSFLPEQHTDFVFSVFAEEWGYRGVVVLLALFLVLVLIGLQIATQARDRHGSFLAIGATALIFWHVFVNIGMVSGLLPVVGVTLPLMSYGGSSVITVMIAVGVLANVGTRRFTLTLV